MDDVAQAGGVDAVVSSDPLALLVSVRDEWKGEVSHALSLAGWRSQAVDTANDAEWRVTAQSPAFILIDFERVDAFCPMLISELAQASEAGATIVTAGGYALTAFKAQMETAGAESVYDGPAEVASLLHWLANTALPMAGGRAPLDQVVSQR